MGRVVGESSRRQPSGSGLEECHKMATPNASDLIQRQAVRRTCSEDNSFGMHNEHTHTHTRSNTNKQRQSK